MCLHAARKADFEFIGFDEAENRSNAFFEIIPDAFLPSSRDTPSRFTTKSFPEYFL
jgi:hypothetical protein